MSVMDLKPLFDAETASDTGGSGHLTSARFLRDPRFDRGYRHVIRVLGWDNPGHLTFLALRREPS
jgi:hypothetical protein